MIRITRVENGLVKGLPAADPRITSFKGIPFAAPPINENRWRAPQKCKDWEGVLEAFEFAPISMQDTPGLGTDVYCREWHVDPDIPMNEDCLYLNVWTNAKSTDEKLPVLVWIFGGGFQWGYTSEMELDMERIARRGIVCVSVNYRLGALGFMAHPQISKEQPDAPANFGLLDQKAGLEWVYRNISSFGGDPENISIMGQSAGGMSTIAQLTCESNFNIIKKAIVLSGIICNPYEKESNPIIAPKTLEEAEQKGVEFLEFLGVNTLEEARKLDASYIQEKYSDFYKVNSFMAGCVDNITYIDDPATLLISGHHADAHLMFGNTHDEFFSSIQANSDEEFEQKVKTIFPDDYKTFLSTENIYQNEDNNYAKVNGIEPSIKAVFEQHEKNGSDKNCYYYHFNPYIPGYDDPKAFHSVDLWFFFETLAKCWRPFVGQHYDLSRQMCNYLSNFIKNGDPNGDDADGTAMPTWEPYTSKNPFNMHFLQDGPRTDIGNSDFMNILIKKLQKDMLGEDNK